MDPALFSETKSGQLIPVQGIGDLKNAFVPDPLPPSWDWSESLWPVLLEARTALARLDGTGKHLPNPELLLKPMQNREAQRSSRLEGTITDPQQQALFQVDPKFPVSDSDPVNQYREVFNYSKALRMRLDGGSELPLSLRLIKDLHKTLMDGVRGSDKSPGEFRRTQNQVGRPARYVPPPMTHLDDALDRFEKYLHSEPKYDPLVNAFLVHYQFEAIHPFGDGNGRVGRLLLAVTIAEWCALANQWLYMSTYFEQRRDEYLQRLLRASTHGDWEGWVRFCLQGVIEQARDTERRCEDLLKLNRDFHQRLQKIRGSVRLATIVDGLFEVPVITVTQVQQRFVMTYPTARNDLRQLAQANIVSELLNAGQITYYCKPIFDITYAD